MENTTIRVHRLGSVTFGVVLVLLGALFMIHLILPALNFMMVFRLWPVVLILLGVEVLRGSRYKTYEVVGRDGQVVEQCKVVYDIPAIILTGCALFMTLGLAWIDWLYVNQISYINLG